MNKLESGFDAHLQLTDLGPHIYAKIIMDTVWVSGHPINAVALMDDDAFKGVVRMNVFTRGYMVKVYQGFEKRMLGLMEQIDRELARRKE